MIEKLTNQYQLSKTLKFSLIPIGKTEENFIAKQLLEEDEERLENYKKVKGYIDRYHKFFIDNVLSKLRLNNISEYAELYYLTGKSESDNKKMENLEKEFRKEISSALKKDKRYKLLFKKEFIRDLLPDFLSDSEEKRILGEFHEFTTYFKVLFKNREKMYTEEAKSTGIAYRCIDDNLPKFLDNCKSFKKIKGILSQDDIEELDENINGLWGTNASDAFKVDYFSFVLSQSGIDKYNQIIGGYTTSDGTKVKGLNEYINLFNQQYAKQDRSCKLPLLKPLYKQILSDRETVSFLPETFSNDNEVIASINAIYDQVILPTVNNISNLFSNLKDYDSSGIYVSSGIAISNLSRAVFGLWSTIREKWAEGYELEHPKKKNTDSDIYFDKESKSFEKIKSFSISDLQKYGENSIIDYYSSVVVDYCQKIENSYNNANELLTSEYNSKKKLSMNDRAIRDIKCLLDCTKELEQLIKALKGTGKEEGKDETFYGIFLPLFDSLTSIDRIYDKVRNYVTSKPYSKDKIKLNFNNPQFLGGWPVNREIATSGMIFRNEGKYYLGVISKGKGSEFKNWPKANDENDIFEKMEYLQAADPQKDVQNLMLIDGKTVKKNGSKEKEGEFAGQNILLEEYKCNYLPEEINRIRLSKSYSKASENYSKKDLELFIKYYMDRVIEYYDGFVFNFRNPSDYGDFKEFTDHVNAQAYQISFKKISKKHLFSLIDSGCLYLFQIYNKDFSEYSHGTPNLHTLYFKMLFDENNLSNVVYKLNGDAEMFYRKASIKDDEKIVHPANNSIKNKNPDNEKRESIFKYDLIKDKRFTKRQFSIHIPITMNFKSQDNSWINYAIRDDFKNGCCPYVIGIDRGERNLIYVCVINSKGEIVEQKSFNEIISDNSYKVDYHNLLDRKEKERDQARKSWSTINNIKDLKEGYISQVVHEICELVVKYDAIIAMEDLSEKFMKSRAKVEKQVYQKFENKLREKLNFLVDKKIPVNENGGLLRAYQLTNKADKNRSSFQDGIIFFVPAWLTSKIDPTTGFVSLIKAKYISVDASKEFFDKFDDIRFNAKSDMFEFDLDYSKFPKGNVDSRQKWTVCSNGDRIKTFRNPEKNCEWDNTEVILTDEYKKLFNRFDIDYCSNLKNKIINMDNKEFFLDLIHLFNLTMQMRNSITGNVDVDYLISPVRNSTGNFYDSRDFEGKNAVLPQDADANGAFNIARKGLWAVNQIKTSDDSDIKLNITNKEWLEFAQKI